MVVDDSRSRDGSGRRGGEVARASERPLDGIEEWLHRRGRRWLRRAPTSTLRTRRGQGLLGRLDRAGAAVARGGDRRSRQRDRGSLRCRLHGGAIVGRRDSPAGTARVGFATPSPSRRSAPRAQPVRRGELGRVARHRSGRVSDGLSCCREADRRLPRLRLAHAVASSHIVLTSPSGVPTSSVAGRRAIGEENALTISARPGRRSPSGGEAAEWASARDSQAIELAGCIATAARDLVRFPGVRDGVSPILGRATTSPPHLTISGARPSAHARLHGNGVGQPTRGEILARLAPPPRRADRIGLVEPGGS